MKKKIVCANNDDEYAQELLELVKKNMLRENVIGQDISNFTPRIVSSWENLVAAEIIVDGERVAAETLYDSTMSDLVLSKKIGSIGGIKETQYSFNLEIANSITTADVKIEKLGKYKEAWQEVSGFLRPQLRIRISYR